MIERAAAVVRPHVRTALIVMLAISVALVLVHLGTHALERSGALDPELERALRSFDANEETTLPSLWSVFLLALIGLLAAVIGVLRRTAGERGPGWWFAVAGVAAVLSLDELLAVHESMSSWFRGILGPSIASGPFYFAWVIPAAVAVLVCLAVFAPFIVRLPRGIVAEAGAGVILFVLGAIGFEILYASTAMHLSPPGSDGSFALDVMVGAEELLEMAGASLIVHALLRHLRDDVLGRAPIAVRLS